MTENIILKDNVRYHLWTPTNEVQQFEPLVIEHIRDIFGEGAKYYSKRTIKTLANNRSIPDGFVIDENNNKWYILELKLLCDDAINRISRQIVNYKNAVNLSTKKEIYEAINEPSQELYNIIYNTTPEIVIIIDSLDDEKGQQFEEQVLGTDRNINIIEFKTYARDYVETDKIHLHLFRPLVGVKSEIKLQVVETVRTQGKNGNQAEALDLLGGGKIVKNIGKTKVYELGNGDKILMKYSKYYETAREYWYGITPSAFEKYKKEKISHLAFIIGTEGVIKLPFDILEKYISVANTTLKPDGSIKHYHVFIKSGLPHILYASKNKEKWDIEEHFISSDKL